MSYQSNMKWKQLDWIHPPTSKWSLKNISNGKRYTNGVSVMRWVRSASFKRQTCYSGNVLFGAVEQSACLYEEMIERKIEIYDRRPSVLRDAAVSERRFAVCLSVNERSTRALSDDVWKQDAATFRRYRFSAWEIRKLVKLTFVYFCTTSSIPSSKHTLCTSMFFSGLLREHDRPSTSRVIHQTDHFSPVQIHTSMTFYVSSHWKKKKKRWRWLGG